jgi:chitodextrinase
MTQEVSLTDTKVETTDVQPEVTKNNPNQDEVSTEPKYTQDQVDAIASKIRKTEEAKVLRKFDGIDVERYQTLIAKEEKAELAEAKRKGEFEKVLQTQAEKSSVTINKLTGELTKIKVEGALLNAASTKKAINPEQVVRLVREQVKMSNTGDVEIIDSKTGQTRYSDTGEALSCSDLVSEFLKSNPHFVQAGPAGAGSSSNTKTDIPSNVDVSKLDMNNPEHRKLYATVRKEQGIN